jgi:hypothetical protein
MGSSIVKIYDKTYYRDRYVCQEIPVTSQQYYHIRNFVEAAAFKPSSFNYWGFYLLPIWPSSGAKKNKWFCSEFIAEALRAGGITFDGYQSHTISPGKLFNLVKDTGVGYNRTMLNSEYKVLNV